MIQGVINRLAQSSFLLKGWSVVLVSALLALAAGQDEALLVAVALLPALTFGGLDGYFLWQERMYRALYDQVRTLPETELDYGMDTRSLPNLTSRHKWRRTVVSRTVLLFHGAVVLTVLIVWSVISRSAEGTGQAGLF